MCILWCILLGCQDFNFSIKPVRVLVARLLSVAISGLPRPVKLLAGAYNGPCFGEKDEAYDWHLEGGGLSNR